MAGRRAGAGLVLAGVTLTAAGCGLGRGTKTVTVTQAHTVTITRTVTTGGSGRAAAACTGAQLKGSFAEVPGSAGAGQIEYELSLRNASHGTCYVRGIPKGTLLGATGAALPTRIRAAGGGGTARVVLPPGASTMAQARFSPDVAGPGDSQSGSCQPVAHTLQVSPGGGGVTDAAIRPATSVCERGTLNFQSYAYAG